MACRREAGSGDPRRAPAPTSPPPCTAARRGRRFLRRGQRASAASSRTQGSLMKKYLARTIALVLVAAMDAAPAFAQGLDVQNGANTVVALIIALFGVIALVLTPCRG